MYKVLSVAQKNVTFDIEGFAAKKTIVKHFKNAFKFNKNKEKKRNRLFFHILPKFSSSKFGISQDAETISSNF